MFTGARVKRWYGISLLLAVASGSPIGAVVQEISADLRARELAADQLVLMTQHSLVTRGKPREDQLVRARILMDMALALLPDDADLWRMARNLANLRSDPDARMSALRKYHRLEPKDDAALLDLIQTRLEETELLDERLAKAEQILQSSVVKQFSAPLRSRLASYAAAAAEELGDDDRLGHWLQQAAELDPSNDVATQMLFRLAVERQAPSGQIADAAVRWVQAAPASPAARIELAKALMNEGVFGNAADQFQMAGTLSAAPVAPGHLQAWVFSLAAAGDVDGSLDLFTEMERNLRAFARQASPEAAPLAASLPADFELLRLSILSATRRADGAEQSFRLLRTILEAQMEADAQAVDQPEDREPTPSGAATQPSAPTGSDTEEAAETQPSQHDPHKAGRTLAWIAAVFDQDLDSVEQWLDGSPLDHAEARRALGWLALRRGETEQARSLLEPLAEEDLLAALGLVQFTSSNPREQEEGLHELVTKGPAQLAGLLAMFELERRGQRPQPTPAGLATIELLERWPRRLLKTDFSYESWLSMQFAVEPGNVGYLEPMLARVTIRNLAGIPLSMGPGRAVPTLLLVTVTPSVGGQSMGALPPLYVDLWRRLRLERRENLEVTFRLDRSSLGAMLALNPTSTFSVKATAVLDPRVSQRGAVRPGPTGGRDTVRAVYCRGIPLTAQNVDQWLVDLDSPDVIEQMRAIARLLNAAAQLGADAERRKVRKQIAETINRRYPDFDVTRKFWTIRFMGRDEELLSALQPVVDLADRSDDPMVRIVYLATHVDDPQSPVLTAAIRHKNPEIHQFGEAMKEGLEIAAEERAKADAAAEAAAEAQK